MLWPKKDERNTIQRKVNVHRRANTIDKLRINGESVEDQGAIKREILSFYQKLYAETEDWRPEFSFVSGPRINEEEEQWLERPFEELEILDFIKRCATDKAPRTDGYSMSFCYSYWETIKDDIMKILKNLLTKSFNATYAALNTKKRGAKVLRDFRPI